MRIGIDARSLMEAYPSGISVYAYTLIKHLAEISPQDTFCLFISGYKKKSSYFIDRLRQYPNIEIHYFKWPNKVFHGLALLGLAPKIDKILKNIDVLFAPNLHFLPRSKNVPLVITMHDLSYELYPHFLSWKRKLWHWFVQPKKLLQQANHVIAVSETTKQDLINLYGLLDSKITRVYSAVPEAIEANSVDNLPKRYCLALSTVEPRKNIAAVVQAFNMFCQRYENSDLDLVVIGSGGWKSKQLIKNMQDHPRIHYYGYISEAEKIYIINQAHGFIYPSIYEGFGFPPLEALRAKVPVITSYTGAIPEVLQQAAFYVDPYYIEDMVTALKVIDQDQSIRNKIILASKKVLEQLNWKTTAEQTLKVIKQDI